MREQQYGRDVADDVRNDGGDHGQAGDRVQADRRQQLEQPRRQADLLDAADDDEQADEEDEQIPVDLAVDLLRVDAAGDEERGGADGRHHGRVLAHQEAGEHQRGDDEPLDHHRAVDRARRPARRGDRPGDELAPEEQYQQRRVERQAEQRHRPERGKKGAVGDLRQAADQHVLRVAGDRRDAADVGAGGERQQVGQRPVAAGARQLDQDRGEHQADGVVDEQRRQRAADEDHGDEQQRRLVDADADPAHRRVEEPGHAEVRDQHHHAEEQHERADVDVTCRLVEREDARGNHQGGADDRGAGAVDAQVRGAADGEDEVGEDEDGAGDDRQEHGQSSGIFALPSGRHGGLREVCRIRYTWGSLSALPPCSSVAQWQSIRLLTGGLLVRVQPEEP